MTRHIKKRSLFEGYPGSEIIGRIIPHLDISARQCGAALRSAEQRFFSVAGMKKLLIATLVLIGTTLPLSAIHAASCANIGDSCTVADGTSGTCAADPDTNGLYCLSSTYGTATANNPGGSSAPSSNTTSGFVPLAPIPGLTQGVAADPAGLAAFFNNLYKYLIGLAAVLAVIMIIWEGLRIATNQDNVSIITDSKGKIYNAIFGLVLVLSPALVFSIINPSILNLSVNLPPLDTKSGPARSTAGTQTPTVDPATQCSVTGTAGILQIATCPSGTAATMWGQNCSGELSISNQTKRADGTITSSTVICSGARRYVFINLGGALSDFALTYLSGLQPLSISSSNQDNGAAALQFANTCSSIGWKTCFSDRPLFTRAIPCDPTPTTSIPVSVNGKCYSEKLSCEESGINTNTSELCSGSPGWTPFQ